MAGIGFTLRRLVRRDDLLGVLQGYVYSALVSTGPWLFTILALAAITVVAGYAVSFREVSVFRIIVIYNFAFSLVFTAPVYMVTTRYLADLIYARDVHLAPGMLVGALAFAGATQAPLVIPFYFFVAGVSDTVALAAVVHYFLVMGLWVVAVFLSALKAYASITRAFALGLALALGMTGLLAAYAGVTGMLLGFSSGLAVILFSLAARVLAEYPYPLKAPFSFLRYFRAYWELALGGLVYNSAIWVDKWIMWFSERAYSIVPGMPSYPDYDSAMFMAYLSIIPAMAMFLVSLETSFFEQYLRFFRDIQAHATLRRIRANLGAMLHTFGSTSRNLVVLQGAVSVILLLLAPRLFELLSINFVQMGVFRLGVLGAYFHVLLALMLVILTYFDYRRLVLSLQTVFLLTNAGFTWVTLELGVQYHGFGYFLGALVAFSICFLVGMPYIRDLPYQTFIRNNLSVPR